MAPRPTATSTARTHLRLRHAPFAIGPAERDRWLLHIRAAIGEVAAGDPDVAEALDAYVTMAAEAMQNRA